MGNGGYLKSAWVGYSNTRGFDQKTADQVITRERTAIVQEFLPKNFKNGLRESRDSVDNPESTPIIVAGDVTGSMGRLGGELIKGGLQRFAEEVYNRKPVTNPHIMGMAVDDVNVESVPVQATQFEADIRILEQFEKLVVIGNGGGNGSESYHLPWLIAARMTAHDAWEQRQQKGVVFTYGDEGIPPALRRQEIQDVLGIDIERAKLTTEEILAEAQERYDVYHLVIEHGGMALRAESNNWRTLLGDNVQNVSDPSKLPEIMVSILQLRAGASEADIAKSWGEDVRDVVARALDTRGRRYAL